MVLSKRKGKNFEYYFRDVEGAPPIAKDRVSALMQRPMNIPIQALNQRSFFSLLYPDRHLLTEIQ